MSRIFADTSYWVALAVPTDQWHSIALEAKATAGNAAIVTSVEVLTEFLNMMSGRGPLLREHAVRIVRAMYINRGVTVTPQDSEGFLRGLERYAARRDKKYSLTDCVSMNIMEAEGMEQVLTSDRHFEQEGFAVLMKRGG